MKATQRVSALRGGQPDDLIASGAGCEGISLRGASMRRKIGPSRAGIRGMSVERKNFQTRFLREPVLPWEGPAPHELQFRGSTAITLS